MPEKTKYLWALLHVLFFFPKIYAAPVVLTDSQSNYSFIENIDLLKEDQHFSFEEMKQKNFMVYSQWKDDLETGQVYWGKFDLENRTSKLSKDREWVLQFSLLLTDIEVFAVYPNGVIEKTRSGFFTPISDRTFVPIVKGNFVKVNLPDAEKVSIFFRAKCERIGAIPKFDIQLSSTSTFFKALHKKREHLGLFIGFVMMMLVYNLFLYFYSAKDQPYLSYSIYLLAIILFSMYNGGEIADFIVPRFLPEHPQWITFAKPIVYFAIIGYLTFLRSFLDLSKVHPRWNAAFKYISLGIIPVLLLDAYSLYKYQFNYGISDIATIGTGLFFIIVVFIFCSFLYRTKNKKGYFVVMGTLAMGVGTLLMILDRFQTADFSTFYFRVGIILEVIIFSLGLAYRRRDFEREKQEAIFELEKSRLIQIQEQNEAERLKELDDLKNRLYTNITHEFRTPLTVIMGVTDNIKAHKKEKGIIQRNSGQLLRLINQMLDLSKMEADLVQLNWVQGDIVVYLQYITESFHSMAKNKNVRLTFYSEDEAIWMDMDESKIEHLTYNLISNAVKFTSSGGKIIFHVKKIEKASKSFLQIKIKDTGIGISEENLPHIFNRFHQNNNEHTVTGTGIGLALVKEIVEVLEGTIEVKSKVGVGSEFSITLPISQNAKRHTSNNLPELVNQSNTVLINEAIENPLLIENTNNNQKENDLDQPILLLIEDNKDVADYIQVFLSKDYKIHIAYDGVQGIELAFRLVPDIIISDVMMPKKNGYEVTRILKYDERTNHIPIILLTAKATQEDKLSGLESGADAFLMKPFHKKELMVRLKKLQELRIHLINKYKSEEKKTATESSNEKTAPLALNENFLQKVKKAILENINNSNLTVADICNVSGLSHTQVYRKLKAITGLTPTLFIRSVRLQEAHRLLKNTEMNVSEVAYSVGFNDPNYFSRVFFQEFGHNPSDIVND